MSELKFPLNLRLYMCLVILLTTLHTALGQASRQEKMEQLSFMVGDWVGTSTTYKNDTVATKIPAFEKISYKLDQHIITIDLHSELLQLHTIIYYDEKEKTYYYHPYYKKGRGAYKAEYTDGKFIVWPSETKRFVFKLTPEGNFQEYGEILDKGRWVTYFEDIFKKIP